jgi:hypothetical protein
VADAVGLGLAMLERVGVFILGAHDGSCSKLEGKI